jgi:leucine dehydrogenase
VINAGGVLQLAGLENLGWDEAELERKLAGIGDTLRKLYRDADANGITPSEAAERLAAERVAAALPSS